jgi:mRNA-degrading endonuclease toxin of MazEF toxin-antitoxin module
VILDLEPAVGHEQGGERRVLVVSYEPFHRSGLMTVCPITSARGDARYPGEVEIRQGEGGQTKPGVVLCHQMRTVSALRTKSHVGYLADPEVRGQVRTALARQLGLDVPSAEDGATGTDLYGPEPRRSF